VQNRQSPLASPVMRGENRDDAGNQGEQSCWAVPQGDNGHRDRHRHRG
jgi:hypothetical protein